jgi:hypothetical protein
MVDNDLMEYLSIETYVKQFKRYDTAKRAIGKVEKMISFNLV